MRPTALHMPVTQDEIADKVAAAISPFGGYLRCETCTHERPLGDTSYHLAVGWPICCGQTMRWWTQRQIDAGEAPAPRSALVGP